jgi:hypothetical protein
MSLPITSSDDAIGWERSLWACLGALGISALLLWAAMIVIDPYDSGKFGWLGIEGVDDRTTFTAAASRARNPQFDSAVIGNSTAQMLDPAELSRATGLRFVQLYMTGARPLEELALLEFFLRHHRRVGALVIVADPFWCVHKPSEPDGPFPYWLYGESSIKYVVRLLSRQSVEHAFQRLSIGFGWRERNDPSGYFSYEDIWPPGTFHEVNRPRDPAPPATAAERAMLPEVSRLDAAIKKLPADIPVVLVVPPTLYTTIAAPGTAAALDREACHAALKRTVAGRPNSNFINYRIDSAMTRDIANFADLIHYRTNVASKISEGIAASLRLGEAAKIDF